MKLLNSIRAYREKKRRAKAIRKLLKFYNMKLEFLWKETEDMDPDSAAAFNIRTEIERVASSIVRLTKAL